METTNHASRPVDPKIFDDWGDRDDPDDHMETKRLIKGRTKSSGSGCSKSD